MLDGAREAGSPIKPGNRRHERLGTDSYDKGVGRHRAHHIRIDSVTKSEFEPIPLPERVNTMPQILQVASRILLMRFLCDKPDCPANGTAAFRENHLMAALACHNRRHTTGRTRTHDQHPFASRRGFYLTRNKILVGKTRVDAAPHVPTIGRDVIALQTAQARHDIRRTARAGLSRPHRIGGERAGKRHHVARALGDRALGLLRRLDGAYERHRYRNLRLDGTSKMRVK